MSSADLVVLSPFLALYLAAVAVMLGVAVRRSHALSFAITVAGLLAALVLLRAAGDLAPRQVTPLLVVDRYAIFFAGVIFVAALCVALLSRAYLRCRDCLADEFYILLLLGAAGSGVMAASRHFASFYLGLEILSVSLYALIGYRCTSRRSTEAAVKYLVLAAAAAAFLLFGAALVYSEIGSLGFAQIAAAGDALVGNQVALAGLALVIVGLGFKLSVAPFHMWTSDVYEGAPAPVGAFIATVPKVAIFSLLLRYLLVARGGAYESLQLALGLIAVASMFVGNLLALRQTRLKRLLAYSSIANLGYVLVAFLAGGPVAMQAVTAYLVAYVAATLGAFGVIAVLSSRPGDHEADLLEDYQGLFHRRPALAAVLSLMLLSLAGIPLTVGFVGKLVTVLAGLGTGLWWQTAALVLNSAIGLVYYLRVINAMFRPAVAGAGDDAEPCGCWLSPVVLGVLALLVVWLGVYPGPLLASIRSLLPPAP